MSKANILTRIISLPIVLILAVAVLFLLGTKQASAQTTDIVCGEDIFLSQYDQDADETQLYRLDDSVAPFGLAAIGSPYSGVYNSHGYSITNGRIYAINGDIPAEIVEIDGAGTVTSMGALPHSASTGSGFSGADLDADEDHNAFDFDGAATTSTNSNRWIITTDISTTPAFVADFVVSTPGGVSLGVGDVAFNPADGMFYGVDMIHRRAVQFDIDKAGGSGVATFIGPEQPHLGPNVGAPPSGTTFAHGSAYMNSKGQLISIRNNNPGAAFVVDLNTGVATQLSLMPETYTSDTSRCPYVPLIEKIGSPDEVEQGGQVTYTFTIYNPIQNSGLTFDFLDVLEDGFTYADESISDAFGGTPNNYGGTDTLSISGMSLAAGASKSFTVKVNVAKNATVGTMYNQACLDNFNIASLVTEICSDYPVTPQFGDETPVGVIPPAAPDTGFELFDQNPAYILGLTSVISLAIVIIARRLRAAKVS